MAYRIVSAQHTPGPWEARTFMVVGGPGFRDRITHVGGNLHPGPPRAYEAEANARLIAAAPDMLAALERMLEWATVLNNLGGYEDVDAAEAAVAKARG